MKPSHYAPELQDLEVVCKAGEIAKDFLDCGSAESGEHMICKPTIVGRVTPWHQGQACHDPTMDERNLNFWIPLDDADVDKGCMQSVAGSTKLDVLPHHSIGNDPGIHGLEVDEPERFKEQVVASPLSAGDAVLHLPKTLRSAGPDTTLRLRRAYIVAMVAPSLVRERPAENCWMRQDRIARPERAAANQAEMTK